MIPIDGAGWGPTGISNPDVQQAFLKTVRKRVLLPVSTQSTQHWKERNHYEIGYENTGGQGGQMGQGGMMNMMGQMSQMMATCNQMMQKMMENHDAQKPNSPSLGQGE